MKAQNANFNFYYSTTPPANPTPTMANPPPSPATTNPYTTPTTPTPDMTTPTTPDTTVYGSAEPTGLPSSATSLSWGSLLLATATGFVWSLLAENYVWEYKKSRFCNKMEIPLLATTLDEAVSQQWDRQEDVISRPFFSHHKIDYYSFMYCNISWQKSSLGELKKTYRILRFLYSLDTLK